MAFEVYMPRSSSDNRVALTKHHIRLGNRMASYLKSDRVEVAYDKTSGKLRVKGIKEGGIKISKNKIGAQGIFKYFSLDKRVDTRLSTSKKKMRYMSKLMQRNNNPLLFLAVFDI